MKKLRFLIVCLLLATLIMGCAPAPDDGGPQTVAGGAASAGRNINIKDIDITSEDGIVTVTFLLLSGSRKTGYPEARLTELPPYEITMLESPQRLKIRFSQISFWDYEPKDTWALSGLVAGLFREVPAQDDSLIIYVQLTGAATFSALEGRDTLTVTLTPEQTERDAAYYCVADAFYEHQEGRWPDDVDMQPVLCSDLESRLLISAPFETEEQAQDYRESVLASVDAALPGTALSVIRLSAGTLPDYSDDPALLEASQRSVLTRAAAALDTPVLLTNGRYLASSSDGRIAFSRKYKPDEPALEQDSYLLSDRLWVLEDGRPRELDLPEFYSIKEAAFSISGRYLALLDASMENSVLYVYDFETQTLMNLGEEGLGSQTAAFVWSDADDVLFAMAGDDAAHMQMRSCTFWGGGVQIDTVEETAGGSGSLAMYQGRLFFADRTAGRVYEISDTRRVITDGTDVCAGFGKLLVLQTLPTESEQTMANLKLCDPDTGETVVVAENAVITDFGFGSDGRVYYLDASAHNVPQGYPYGLYVCDADGMGKKLLAYCAAERFATDAVGMLYFIDYIGDDENGFSATYSYSLSQS